MNFAGHSILGLLVGSIAAALVAQAGPASVAGVELALALPAIVLVLVYLGAVYPDVDMPGTIPQQTILPAVQAIFAMATVAAITLRWESFSTASETVLEDAGVGIGPMLAGAIGLLVCVGLAAFLAQPILDVITGPHRSWTHSLVVNILLSTVAAAAIWMYAPLEGESQLVVAALPFAFLVGVLVHLVADEDLLS